MQLVEPASVLALFALSLFAALFAYARHARLIIRLAMNSQNTPSERAASKTVRLLLHNAEQSMDVDGLRATLSLFGVASGDFKLVAHAGPDAHCRVSSSFRREHLDIVLTSEEPLCPGRSWMFEVVGVDRNLTHVHCVVGSRADRTSRRSTVCVDSIKTVKLEDTMHVYVFTSLSFLAALACGGVVLRLLLGALTWQAISGFLVGPLVASFVIYRLVRPINPHVALGYTKNEEAITEVGPMSDGLLNTNEPAKNPV